MEENQFRDILSQIKTCLTKIFLYRSISCKVLPRAIKFLVAHSKLNMGHAFYAKVKGVVSKVSLETQPPDLFLSLHVMSFTTIHKDRSADLDF